jgi:diaminopimelate epimerase
MRLAFSKWHGTGNDFILVDDRGGGFPAHDPALVRRLCDRHFGIGSDGLILLQPPREPGMDFHMEFFNPDASRSFCGNGSRCAFAAWSGLHGRVEEARFTAIDGPHVGAWEGDLVAVTLGYVPSVAEERDHDFVNNGSPHEILRVPDVDAVEVAAEGPRRAHRPERGPGGTNVNWISVREGRVRIRTFERGVEAETLSCGTGVVAAALSALARGEARSPVPVRARGGDLTVEAERVDPEGWGGIRLIGPAERVFDGTIDL